MTAMEPQTEPSPAPLNPAAAAHPWAAAAVSLHSRTPAPHAGSVYVARRAPSRFFEGWYLRLVLPDARSLAFMFSIEAGDKGTVQLLDDEETLHMTEIPLRESSRFSAEKRRLSVAHWGYVVAAAADKAKKLSETEIEHAEMHGYHLAADSSHGRFEGKNGRVQWGFEFDPVLSWGERGQEPLSTASWLARLPFFDPGYQVVMAHGLATGGYVEVHGERVNVEGGVVYCEKNWGASFPSRWWWLQANSFEEVGDLSVTALGAIRSVLGFKEVAGVIAIHLNGVFYEFANWTCETLDWAVQPWGDWRGSSCAKTGHKVEFHATTIHDGAYVLGPTSSGMKSIVRDCARGQLTITLRDPDGVVLLDGVRCESAQVEVGGGPWNEVWKAKDAARLESRLAHQRFIASVHAAHERRESVPPNLPCSAPSKYDALGGPPGRAALLAWLFSESRRRHLTHATTALAVAYFERLLARVLVPIGGGAEFAATCLGIAAKMEEGANGEDIGGGWEAELYVLQALEWDLVAPTAVTFLGLFQVQVWLPPRGRVLALKYLEHVLMYVDSQAFYPSSLALVCILLLERDGLLPAPCKTLTLAAVRAKRTRAEEVTKAFRCFRYKCPSPIAANDVLTEGSDVEWNSASSTTAYALSVSSSEASSHQW